MKLINVCLATVVVNNIHAQPIPQGRYVVKYLSPSGEVAARRAASAVHIALDNLDAIAATYTQGAITELRDNPEIEYIEEDSMHYINANASHAFLRGSPRRRLDETIPYGIPMVEADKVNNVVKCNKKVCVIDSGYDLGHEDLPTVGVSGHSIELEFPLNTFGIWPWDEDIIEHGTHVTGTIAALKNELGVVGVADGPPDLHIVRIFAGANDWSVVSEIALAVEKCKLAGADVINMSFGGSVPSQVREAAMQDAFDAGILLVAAAGNGGNGPNPTAFRFPASYDTVISVAAIDSSKSKASFSQWNSQVELSAPGVHVESTVPGNMYSFKDGTSMAAPHVSGVASLIWSHYPGCTHNEIRKALDMSAEDLGDTPGRDDFFGFGLVQAKKALDYLDANSCAIDDKCEEDNTLPPTTPAPTPPPTPENKSPPPPAPTSPTPPPSHKGSSTKSSKGSSKKISDSSKSSTSPLTIDTTSVSSSSKSSTSPLTIDTTSSNSSKSSKSTEGSNTSSKSSKSKKRKNSRGKKRKNNRGKKRKKSRGKKRKKQKPWN